MSTTSVTFKCYYGNEIRRFNLPVGDGAISYSSLVHRIQDAFSIPPSLQLRLRWQDDEGDRVMLTSNEELLDAVRYLVDRADRPPTQAVRILVTAAEAAAVHEGVMCDGCGGGVSGHRFKCMLCPDFDLCSACMTADAHSQHPMLLIRRPREFPGGGGARGFRGGCGGGRRWGGCGRGGGGDGPARFRDFVAKVAADVAAAAADAGDAAAATGAAADAASKSAPPPPPATNAAAEEPMATEERPEERASAAGFGFHGNGETPDVRVARALEHMKAMGFSDDGGWLTRLLVAKGGDISAVLDAIRPAK